MTTEHQQLSAAIDALEAQRLLLGDSVVDTAVGPMRARLAVLSARQAADASVAGGQALKQVTVLFVDVVGSTTLSQQLDPEDVHNIMNDALTGFTAIVQTHRGKVLNYAGDSVLAAFGADEVREDDPERAVLAGLALLKEGARQGERVLRHHGQAGFNVRVGVHTGDVLLGRGVDGDGNIRGFTVNVAARMEQTAPPGAMRISQQTYSRVRGVFDVLAQPPIEVKGVAEPVATYLVQRRKPRAVGTANRGIEGVRTRMVGREIELEQLQDAFSRLLDQGSLTLVTVAAEAGLGKSRLFYEFKKWLETHTGAFNFFQGRAQPLTLTQPYGLLRDIIARQLKMADTDSMDQARKKVEEGVVPLFEADEGAGMAQAHAHLLGHLIGLDFSDSKHIQALQHDARQIRNRGFHAAAQILRRVAAQDSAPLLLLLDDLHWADDSSLDFLNYLVQVNRDVPMLMLTLTRPALFERRADWPGAADSQRIILNALDKGSSHQLVKELLKKMREIPAVLRELITDSAGGNPFYMEELVKMLVDVGVIDNQQEGWSVNLEKLLSTHVPQTLTGVLQARLDGLKPAEKLALQQASAIGFVFWDQALAALDPRSPPTLPALLQQELTTAHQETALDGLVEGVREYAFAHQLLHQVTYDTLLKRTRREYHATAAGWLAAQTGARANDFLGATAEHFARAGDREQSCEFFTRAAEHAAERFAHEAAMEYVARALPLTEQPLQRWRLLNLRERTLDLQGRRQEQALDVDALQQLADTLDDDGRRCEVAWRRSSLAMRTGDYQTMQQAARQTLQLAKRTENAKMELHGQHRLALALTYLGDCANGHALATEGLAMARAIGERSIEALFLNALSVIADSQADQLASLEIDRQDLLINREIGNRRNEAIALGNLGNGWLRLGEHAQARHYLEDCLQLARSIGDRATEPHVLTNLSVLALRLGDDALALTRAQAAVDIATDVQSPVFEAIARCALGNAELALGRPDQAQAAFERALEIARQLDNATEFDALAGLARVALARQDPVSAMPLVERLLESMRSERKLDGSEAPYLIRLTCQQVLAQAGDSRAAQVLGSAHADLLAQALTIGDADLRHCFLSDIPEHQAIMAAWTPDPVRRL